MNVMGEPHFKIGSTTYRCSFKELDMTVKIIKTEGAFKMDDHSPLTDTYIMILNQYIIPLHPDNRKSMEINLK